MSANPVWHVLVVDDYRDTAEALAALLVQLCPFDISTDIAHDGAEALALARARPPTVAVLDIDMPVMDGVEAATAIRAHLRHSPVLLVALTGNPGRLAAMNVHRAFDHVLSKPVNVDRLIALLHQHHRGTGPPPGTPGQETQG